DPCIFGSGSSPAIQRGGPHREGEEPEPMMHGSEKSDPSIVAGKPTNNSEGAEAESVERREGAKGNTVKHGTRRTQSRGSVFPGLERVRERARTEKKEQFTALLHHLDVDLLRVAFSWLKRDVAPGVDGRTWRQYEI